MINIHRYSESSPSDNKNGRRGLYQWYAARQLVHKNQWFTHKRQAIDYMGQRCAQNLIDTSLRHVVDQRCTQRTIDTNDSGHFCYRKATILNSE